MDTISSLQSFFYCSYSSREPELISDEIFPPEILERIFFYLDLQDLNTCSLTNRQWRQVSHQPLLYAFIQQNKNELKLLANHKDLHSSQLPSLTPFMHFLDEGYDGHFFKRALEKKQFCKNVFLSSLDIKKPLISHGEWTFAIFQGVNITINRLNEPEWIYQSPNRFGFCQLALDHPFLYAMQLDGTILQINYQDKIFVQEIQTPCWKKYQDDGYSYTRNLLYIEEGWLIRTFPLKNKLECIPLASFAKAYELESKLQSARLKICEGKLLIQDCYDMEVWDLEAKEGLISIPISHSSPRIRECFFYKGILFYLQGRDLHIKNCDSGQSLLFKNLLPVLTEEDHFIHYYGLMMVRDNLLFFHRHNQILIYDLFLQKKVHTIVGCFEEEDKELRAQLLNDLVRAYLKWRRPFDPAQFILDESKERVSCSVS